MTTAPSHRLRFLEEPFRRSRYRCQGTGPHASSGRAIAALLADGHDQLPEPGGGEGGVDRMIPKTPRDGTPGRAQVANGVAGAERWPGVLAWIGESRAGAAGAPWSGGMGTQCTFVDHVATSLDSVLPRWVRAGGDERRSPTACGPERSPLDFSVSVALQPDDWAAELPRRLEGGCCQAPLRAVPAYRGEWHVRVTCARGGQPFGRATVLDDRCRTWVHRGPSRVLAVLAVCGPRPVVRSFEQGESPGDHAREMARPRSHARAPPTT